jgi:hypothetical protein
MVLQTAAAAFNKRAPSRAARARARRCFFGAAAAVRVGGLKTLGHRRRPLGSAAKKRRRRLCRQGFALLGVARTYRLPAAPRPTAPPICFPPPPLVAPAAAAAVTAAANNRLQLSRRGGGLFVAAPAARRCSSSSSSRRHLARARAAAAAAIISTRRLRLRASSGAS